MAATSSSTTRACLSELLLPIVRNMSGYALHLYKCSMEGGVSDENPHQVFTLPEPLRKIVKESVELFKSDALISGSDILLEDPNRSHVLTEKIKQCYEAYSETILTSDLDFIRWCAMCFVSAAQLCEKRFVEAPFVVIQAICNLVVTHDKFGAFRAFGCSL